MVKDVRSKSKIDGYRLVPSLAAQGIYVDSYGNVCTLDSKDNHIPIKTLYKKREGWAAYIFIRVQGKRRHIRIGRLVAEAWLEDFDPRKYIFHHDEDSSNNHVDNLYQKVDHD